jgi:Cu-Zn family superoxide dismutase
MKRFLLAMVLVAACTKPVEEPPPAAAVTTARRAKVNVQGSKIRGVVFINPVGAGIKVQGVLRGFGKRVTHGIAITAARDCAAATAHFNPKNDSHGGPVDTSSHLGDLGNISSGSDGEALLSILRPGARLDTGTSGVIGRALVIYEALDDLKTQPDGEAGKPVACGIITPEG